MVGSFIFSILFAIASGFTVPHVEASSLSKDELVAMAMAEATAHHLDINRFLATIDCESQWNVYNVSPTEDYGLAQIHIKSWGITKEQAFDPIFSLDFMANQFASGGAHYWVCYNKIRAKNIQTQTM